MNRLTEDYQDQINFQQHNIISPVGEAWANQYGLRGHPAIVLLSDEGNEFWRYIGVVSSEQIEKELISVLEN